MSDATPIAKRPAHSADIADRASIWAMTLFVAALLVIFLLFPLLGILLRSLETADGLGLGNFISTFSAMRFWRLVGDSILVSLTSTLIVVVVAYGYAYALQRAVIPAKWFLRIVVLVPLFAPSLVQAQGLILLLGRNGILNRYLGFDLDIYGFWGVAIANALYAFPYAFLILSAALAVADARIYESAEALGAGPLRIFRDVTLPATRYGLAATLFIVFMLAITDFGNPMVIGGDFNVLATEVYNQVIGQAQFGLGAVIGVALLVPAMLAKLIEKRLTARQHALVTEQSRPLTVRASRGRDIFFSLYAYVVAGLVLSVVAIVVFASFVHLWPYNMSFTLRHYRFDVQNGTDPLWNSVFVAFATAIVGIVVTGLGAIVVHKFKTALTGPLSFLAILPAAVPRHRVGPRLYPGLQFARQSAEFPLWNLCADHHSRSLLQSRACLPDFLDQPETDWRDVRRSLDHAGGAHQWRRCARSRCRWFGRRFWVWACSTSCARWSRCQRWSSWSRLQRSLRPSRFCNCPIAARSIRLPPFLSASWALWCSA